MVGTPYSNRCLLALLLLVLGTVGCLEPECAKQPTERPSIVLIMIDTLRVDHLSTHGYSRQTAPNLARFSDEAAWFAKGVAAAPWTGPSVASMFTGLYPDELGLHKLWAARLPQSMLTLAEVLQQAGYATGAIIPNPSLAPAFGQDQGFDQYYFEQYTPLPDPGVAPFTAREVTDKALEWIGETSGPFFAYVHYMDPHEPYLAPPAWRDRFVAADDRIEESWLIDRKFAMRRWLPSEVDVLHSYYEAEIAYVDHEIGRLLDSLPQDLLVVVIADHGEEFQEHGGFLHGHTLYEELLRIPLAIRGPGVCPGRVDAPASHVDTMPTLLGLAGIAIPEGLSGQSLVPVLRKRSAGGDRTLFSVRGWKETTWVAARNGPWKLVYSPEADQMSLFNLEQDPEERKDLSAEEARTVQRLLNRIKDRQELMQEPPPPDELEPEREKQLRALGYIN